ncbi:MAG: pilus assembly protein PilM [Candidatus Omnitrophica bacterium]|nr:pilus assembly protein PilM [Candidatus Omnitrophota bacterium]
MGAGFIKIAQARFVRGKRIVTRLTKEPLEAKEDDALAAEINGIFERLDIGYRRVMLNIPRHLVTIRFLKLPSTDDAEILKMSKIESLKHIPYADEEMISGCKIIEKFPDGYSTVLIAVAQAETVKKEAELLKKAGISVESAALGSEALSLWYSAGREAADGKTVLLANIDSDHIDINITKGDELVFTRGVSYDPGKPISSERMIEQIHLSMAAYRKESGISIDKICLSGIPAKAGELKAFLAERVKVPVEVMAQMEAVPVAEGPSPGDEEASYIELIGLILKSEEVKVDLLPETTRAEYRLGLIKNNIVVGLSVSALIILIAFGAVIKKLHDKNAYVAYVKTELAKIEPQVRSAKKMAKTIDLVTSKIAERPLAIDLVTEVFKITPPGIGLSTMEYEKGKTVTLKGTALNLSDVFKYIAILEKSQYFENVKVRYANKRTAQSAEAADFEIICPIAKAK